MENKGISVTLFVLYEAEYLNAVSTLRKRDSKLSIYILVQCLSLVYFYAFAIY